MGDYFGERYRHIFFASWQHFSLVAQCLILATIISVLIAVLVYRNKSLSGIANSVSAIGLTIPSFALIGLLIVPFGFGVAPAVIVVDAQGRVVRQLRMEELENGGLRKLLAMSMEGIASPGAQP